MLLAAIIVGLLVGFSIAAIIFTSACSLARVQSPGFFFGMVICVMVGMAVFALQVAAGVAGTLGAGISLTKLQSALEFQKLLNRGAPVSVLFSPFISAGIYSVTLRDCTFWRGLLVWVMQFVVIIILVAGIVGLIYGLGLVGKH